MNGNYSTPLLIKNKVATSLKRAPLVRQVSEKDYDEQWLQNLLFTHPQSLPIADIDDSFLGIVPICREMNTPAGPIDNFYLTPRGKPVILEAKLWRNPEARRKVIGQILDYAKELTRFDYDALDAAVRAARRSTEREDPPRGLFDIVSAAAPDTDEAHFVDSVSRNLRRGDVLLLIAGDGIHEGAGAIADFLESHGTLHFTFGMVEMAIFDLPDGSTLVEPRVITQSEIIRRVVVELKSDQMVATDEEAEELEASDQNNDKLEKDRVRFRAFWTKFLAELQLDDKSQPIRPPAASQNQPFHMPKGTQAWISASLVPSAGRASVFLTLGQGPIGDRLYEALTADRESISNALGVPAEWAKGRDERQLIKTSRSFPGRLLEDNADEVRRYLADVVNRYINVFKPRLERLVEHT
jgi:hypothetical protein